MSQDIVSDALSEIMNAKKARKNFVILKKHSKLLRNILEIAKKLGYLDYKDEKNNMKIEIKNINEIKAIKPRYAVSKKRINHYVRRFLPAKDFGIMIISTNKGLMEHYEAEKQNMGGCLIAYIF